MKKLILVVLCYLSLTIPSQATDFVYTGFTAEKIDPIGYYPGGYGALGGPAANERLGLAQQFIIDEETVMTFLDVHATVTPVEGTTVFNYKLYTDSTYNYLGSTQTNPIPLTSSLALTSDPILLTTTADEDHQNLTRTYDMQVPFNYTMGPGKYWLAAEGGGGTYVYLQQSYIDPPLGGGSGTGGNVAHTPEAGVWILFAGLLLWGMLQGRRNVALG